MCAQNQAISKIRCVLDFPVFQGPRGFISKKQSGRRLVNHEIFAVPHFQTNACAKRMVSVVSKSDGVSFGL